MISSLIQAILKFFGASPTMLLLLYGFFMASVLGFMGDQGYGTDEGFSLRDIGKKVNDKSIEGLGAQLKYIFGTLTSSSFWRFIITVFLDMFISSPIQSVIVAVFNPHIELLKNTIPSLPKILGSLLNIVIINFDNVLQSFVAFITFLAYANDTRFRWAYPGSDVNPNLLISTSVIKISTAIAGVIYLIANISADFNIIDGATMKVGTSLVDRLDRKMWFVLIMIGLLTLGSLNNDSFLNKKNNRYDIKPLVNMTDDSIWRFDDELLMNFYNDEILKLAAQDKYKTLKPENRISQDGLDNIIENYIKDINLEFNKEEIKSLISSHGNNNDKGDIDNVSENVVKHFKDIFDTCRSKTGYWDICEVDPDTGNLILDTDTNTGVKTLGHYKKDVDDLEIKVSGKLDNNNKISPTTLKLIDNIYQEAPEDINDINKMKLKDYIKYKKGWDNNPPCFIPDNEYIDKCSDYDKDKFANTNNNQPLLNENNGKLVKKIDMGLYRTQSSNIEDKFDIIDKSNKGFGIFCLYIFIGIIIPFIPIKFIYGDELKEKGRLWKLIVVFIIAYGFAGILYFIASKSPDSKTLKKTETIILSNL